MWDPSVKTPGGRYRLFTKTPSPLTTLFITLCWRLPSQVYGMPISEVPLHFRGSCELPDNIASFLAAVLDEDYDTISQCWRAIRDMLPDLEVSSEEEQDTLFRVHSSDFEVSAETIQPPHVVCQSEGCNYRRLTAKHGPVKARIFTLRRGVLPAFAQSLYCRGCDTVITITTALLVLGNRTQASAEGIAETYNSALGGSQGINRSSLEEWLHGSHVYSAFFLHALLRDKQRRESRCRCRMVECTRIA
ncbi:hypothetical protein BD626DRAFT_572385 [Schizophyllum amplum]|uniref:CxC5 like cysteine cluster associated with KDZ domain-containing protein n=1 Tax=Schizophyllum amplum TaxID=97359 RepID=A0A550C4J1_9AGAR|nr:hypothetical protein BD626DRAFT_572385 [Auriculariopsis ampla]